jgi:hypothetical protein
MGKNNMKTSETPFCQIRQIANKLPNNQDTNDKLSKQLLFAPKGGRGRQIKFFRRSLKIATYQ